MLHDSVYTPLAITSSRKRRYPSCSSIEAYTRGTSVYSITFEEGYGRACLCWLVYEQYGLNKKELFSCPTTFSPSRLGRSVASPSLCARHGMIDLAPFAMRHDPSWSSPVSTNIRSCSALEPGRTFERSWALAKSPVGIASPAMEYQARIATRDKPPLRVHAQVPSGVDRTTVIQSG